MTNNIKLCEELKIEPDEMTIQLFEELLSRARKGEIIGGIVIGLERNGEVSHWVKSSQARIADLVFGLKTTEFNLLRKFNYDREEV